MHDPLRIAGKYTVLEAQHVHSMHAASQLGRLSHLPGALSMEEHRPRAERYPVLAVIFLFSHQSLLRLGPEGFFPYSCSYWVWSSATSAETGFSPRTLRGVLSTKGSLSLSLLRACQRLPAQVLRRIAGHCRRPDGGTEERCRGPCAQNDARNPA